MKASALMISPIGYNPPSILQSQPRPGQSAPGQAVEAVRDTEERAEATQNRAAQASQDARPPAGAISASLSLGASAQSIFAANLESRVGEGEAELGSDSAERDPIETNSSPEPSVETAPADSGGDDNAQPVEDERQAA